MTANQSSRVAWIFLVALSALLGTWFLSKHSQPPQDKLIIAIAEIDGTNLSGKIIANLNSNFKDHREIEMTRISEATAPAQGSGYARSLGKKLSADFVVWGYLENSNVVVRVENLTSWKIVPRVTTLRPRITLADLETFAFQQSAGGDTSALVAFLSGLIEYQSQNYEAAVAQFDKALAGANQFEVYFKRASAYARLKKYDLAIQDLNQALALNSQSAPAFANRGWVYNEIRQFERAVPDLDKALALDPQLALAYNNRGWSYTELKRYDLAIQDLDKALALEPQNAWAYNNRGNAYYYIQPERAIQDYDKALEIDPQFFWAYNNRGNAYYNLKQYERAIQDYDQAIELDPSFARAYNNRGNAYDSLKQVERAIQDYDKSIQLDAQFASAYNNRGWAYNELGRYDLAIPDLDKAIELDPQYALAYSNRGLAHQKLGNLAQAQADFAKYAELLRR